MPLFSIVIPTRNRAALLVETLRSVESQRLKDYELIVVDDGSSDDTPERLKAFPWITVIRNEAGSGVAAARNKGISAATGDYVCFLDDDDIWFPWTLETYAEAIRLHQSPAQITSNGTTFVDPAELEAVRQQPSKLLVFRDYLAYATNPVQPGWLLPTGVCLRRDHLVAAGGFDPSFRYFEDEYLWLALGDAPGYIRVSEPLCWGYRSHRSTSADIRVRFKSLPRLIEKERLNSFPGGPERQRERRSVIARIGRNLARIAAAQGYFREASRVYAQLFVWNAQLFRLRFLILYPAELMFNAFRGRVPPIANTSAPAG